MIIKLVFDKLFKMAMKSGQLEVFCGLSMAIYQVPSKRGYAHDQKYGMKDWEIMLFHNGKKLDTKFDERYYITLKRHIGTFKKHKFYPVYEPAYE